jgi:hypothetical protein
MTPRTRNAIGAISTFRVSSSKSQPTGSRRPHKKSRNGCSQCKQRHIRCDETRPICAHCTAASCQCSYPVAKPSKKSQKRRRDPGSEAEQQSTLGGTSVSSLDPIASHDSDAVAGSETASTQVSPPDVHQRLNLASLQAETATSSLQAVTSDYHSPPVVARSARGDSQQSDAPRLQLVHRYRQSIDGLPTLPTSFDRASDAVFTPQHLVLLFHSGSVPNMIGDQRNAVDIAIRHIMDAPYLLDEVLAFTAFHLATLHSDSATYLRFLATELQTRALDAFTRLTRDVPHDDKDTAVPRFLFSAILGRHALAESLTYCSTNFHEFIARFTTGIDLNRGIRSVCPPAWDHLYRSEMRPFLEVIRSVDRKIISPGDECTRLSRIMDASDLKEHTVQACRQAIVTLQWTFDICRGLDEVDFPQAASAFHVRVEPGYLHALRKHQPEALVILAYYGVILHRCRGFKAFGDAGRTLVRAIVGQLSNYWQDAITWPFQQVEDLHDPSLSNPKNSIDPGTSATVN